MIADNPEYYATKASTRHLEQGLAHAEERAHERHPLLQHALRGGIEHELCLRYRAMIAYEAEHPTLAEERTREEREDIGWSLIRARIIAWVSQAELAHRLGLAEEDIRRMEAARYAGISLELMQQIANAIGTQVRIVQTVT